MPLLLIPFLLLALLALLLLLWPVGLWLRYRAGRAWRQARPAWVSLNAYGLSLSSALFLLGAVVAGVWIEAAGWSALAGLLAGMLASVAGLRLARYDAVQGRLSYLANPWIGLVLGALLAARVALASWQAWYRIGGEGPAPVPWPWLAEPASLWSVAGLLLGYHLGFAWGLRRRLRRLGMLRGRWRMGP